MKFMEPFCIIDDEQNLCFK